MKAKVQQRIGEVDRVGSSRPIVESTAEEELLVTATVVELGNKQQQQFISWKHGSSFNSQRKTELYHRIFAGTVETQHDKR